MKTMLENNILTVFLEGRIDSNSAPAAEQEILSAVKEAPGAEIVLDAEELEYISSAGLRVLMKLRKQSERALTVLNVSPEIYEIFDVTGFTQLLDVKKRLRKISVEGCEVVGEGATSVVYRLDPDTIVKVFRPGVRYEMISEESKKARNAFVAGIPTAIAFDLVKVGDSYGTVYEMLNAKELIRVLVEDKAHLADHIRDFARLLREMHRIEVDPAQFAPMKAASMGALSFLEGQVTTPEETKKLRGIFENIPDRSTFVHGDCHPGNVMVQDGEMMLIDLSNGGSGHPIFDLMSMYLTYRVNPMDPVKRRNSIMLKDFTDGEIGEIWRVFLRSYLDTEDEELAAKAERQIDGFASARVLLAVPFIPGLLSEQAIQYYKQKAVGYYDAGLEEICF